MTAAASSFRPSCKFVGLRHPLPSEHLGVLGNELEAVVCDSEIQEQVPFDPFRHRFTAADVEVLMNLPVVRVATPVQYVSHVGQHSVLDFLATASHDIPKVLLITVPAQGDQGGPPANTNKSKKPV